MLKGLNAAVVLAVAMLLSACSFAISSYEAGECSSAAEEANTKEAWDAIARELGIPESLNFWTEERAREGKAWGWAACMSRR